LAAQAKFTGFFVRIEEFILASRFSELSLDEDILPGMMRNPIILFLAVLYSF